MLDLIIAIIGAGGIIAQTVLVRELLVSFLGNELTIGLILASWMLGEAAGALIIGAFASTIKEKRSLLIVLLSLFSICAFACLAAVRLFKPVMGIATGQGIATGMILLLSFLLMLPAAFCHGGLFSALCAMTKVWRVYAMEAIGTLLGGIVLTLWALDKYSHFQIICTVSLLSAAICLFYLRYKKRLRVKVILYPLALGSFVFFLILKPAQIEQYTLSRQYRQGKVIDYRSSWYGNAVVTQKQGQRVFFYNGVPAITTPVPDVTYAREFGHLPLLFVEKPKNIMVVNAGLGGLVSEILKQPVDRIDYCQQDSLMVRFLWKYPSRLTESELTDARLNVIHKDARTVLRDEKNIYDVIYIGGSMPSDLASNRFFTDEFFGTVCSRLKPSGVLALCLPGSLTYISPQLRDMNYMVLNAVNRHFGRVRLIPGDYNIILASESAELNVGPSVLSARLAERGVVVPLLNPGYLKSRLNGLWIEWFRRSTIGATQLVNRDDKPVAVYQSLICWNKQFSAITLNIMQWLSGVRLWIILIVMTAGGLIVAAAVKLWPRRGSGIAALSAVASSGFMGMTINLAVIYSFQNYYGYMFQMIGALTAVFMAGSAAGSVGARYFVRRISDSISWLATIEIAAVIFSIVTYILMVRTGFGVFFAPILFVLNFLAGVLLGAEFIIGAGFYSRGEVSSLRANGAVFAADLVGGIAAAVLAGVILLPLLGVAHTILALAALKAISAINIIIIKKVK
jgi:spermidine synthase